MYVYVYVCNDWRLRDSSLWLNTCLYACTCDACSYARVYTCLYTSTHIIHIHTHYRVIHVHIHLRVIHISVYLRVIQVRIDLLLYVYTYNVYLMYMHVCMHV